MFYIGRQWFLNIEINPQMFTKYFEGYSLQLIAEEIEDFIADVQPQNAPDIIPAELHSYSDVVPIIQFIDQQLSQQFLHSNHIDMLSNLKYILENKYSPKSEDNSSQALLVKNQSSEGEIG